MPLRRRYRTRSLLLLATGVSLLMAAFHLLGVFGWIVQAAMISQRYFGQDRAAALLPAGVVLGVTVLGTIFWRSRRVESVLAALAVMISLLSPRFLTWYTWNVVGDHTANIGAGILMLAQPVLAPVAGIAGWLVGWALKAAVFPALAGRRPPPNRRVVDAGAASFLARPGRSPGLIRCHGLRRGLKACLAGKPSRVAVSSGKNFPIPRRPR